VVFSETQESLWGIPCGSFTHTYQAFLDRVHPDDRAPLSHALREAIELKKDYEREFRVVWPDGSCRWILGKGQGLYDETGQCIRLLSVSMDITDGKRSAIEKGAMERRLHEAQKYESIGVLASGIAHDFNNILASILGNATLAQMEKSQANDVQTYLKRIEDASLRAADLCKQMLAYAGEGRFSERALDLNEVIRGAEASLGNLVGKKAVLNFRLSLNLPMIQADPSQLLQILNNLVVNASEALGDPGGNIVISSKAVQLKQDSFGDYMAVSDLVEATYVVLEIADNGCGMDAATVGRAFDPFFSTKFPGRGLGLAAVHGIVRKHHGTIKLRSQPGSGTTIQILFPSIPDRGPEALESSAPLQGTILAIDDEPSVLAVVGSYLKSLGLKALVAKDGEEGIALFREKAGEIDAVMLDLTMPTLDGVATFRELQRIRSGVPVLLMSGYMEQDALVEFSGLGLAGFIQKPFSREALRQKLAAVLRVESAASRR
jgi:signal transduction histidine kinase/CheY-like chemotaxis protein